jgi:RNA polymerase sigma factor (sigma-70 family)
MTNSHYETYIKAIKNKILDTEEEARLLRVYAKKDQGWEEAHDLIIKSSLMFVVKAAFEFTSDPHRVCELISEGNLALLHCLERFDPERGVKLISYAAREIRGRMIKHITKSSIFSSFHISERDRENYKKTRNFIEQYSSEKGKNPTSEEIQAKLGFNQFYADLYLEMYESHFAAIGSAFSFEEEEKVIELQDPEAPDPSDETSRADVIKIIKAIVNELPERQRIILNKRFGLNGEQETNLDVIGEQFKLSKERIRQIESEALKKVRKEMEKFV